MYQYGSTKSPSLDDKFLYHFTSAKSLFKILETMTLKMSSFKNLNDLNENEVSLIFQDFWEVLKIEKIIAEHCQLLSFTQNFQNKRKSFIECGCNHPRMWAQYADNNKGACIVINEENFIKTNSQTLNWIFWKIKDVDYKPCIPKVDLAEPTDPTKFLKKNYKKLFFKKHNDWKQENERRLFCIGKQEYLSIDNCIGFISLGSRFNEASYSKLSEILISSIDNDFKKLIPHDFTFQKNADGRCVVLDNAFRIIENIRKKENYDSKYFTYLNENGYDIQSNYLTSSEK